MTAESAGFQTILGVDCATVPKNVGLARARLRDGDWHLTETRLCSVAEPPAEVLASWIEQDGDCLLALDAPLGWPAPLSRELASHMAGNAIHTPADEMFSRTTDRFVKHVYKKHPLEVGPRASHELHAPPYSSSMNSVR